MSQDHNHLNHATWECKYHVVFTPKYRKKALFGQIRRHLGTVFRELAQRKECKIEEGHLMPDHVHMLISIPPKYSVGEVIGISEREKLDLDCAECGTQAAQFSWPQILGEGLLRFDCRAGRGDDPHLHQKSGNGRPAVGPATTEAGLLIKSYPRPKSFITASGGSPANPQLCWGSLAETGGQIYAVRRATWVTLCGD